MKSVLRFSSALALAALVGCSQNQQPVAPPANDTPQNLAANSSNAPVIDVAKAKAEFDRRVAEHEAVLAKKGKGGDKNKVTVPDDYATIQEAVDNATAGAKINVKSGSYTGGVVVNKANLEITASGNVTLTGAFSLAANGITIHNFKIVSTGFAGIQGSGVSGAEVKDNTVSGGLAGILFFSSTNCTIKANTVSGSDVGILLNQSNGNTIDENTASGNSFIGIHLQTDSDDNEITGNTCKFNGSNGIVLTNGCDRNQLKDNVCNGNFFGGIRVDNNSNNNTIGSDNTANANSQYGIYLTNGSSNNTIKKNTAKGNTTCDIFNDGSGSGNVLSKNSADCVSGF